MRSDGAMENFSRVILKDNAVHLLDNELYRDCGYDPRKSNIDLYMQIRSCNPLNRDGYVFPMVKNSFVNICALNLLQLVFVISLLLVN